MAVTYAADVKTSRMQAVLDQIDAGTGAGYIEICSAAYASTLASITLSDPAGSVSGSVLTFTMPKSDTSADAGGTAAIARIRDSDANDVVTGLTVGTGSEDIQLDSVSISAGQTVTLSSASLTHA